MSFYQVADRVSAALRGGGGLSRVARLVGAFLVPAAMLLGGTAYAGLESYVYDKMGRLTGVNYPDGSTAVYRYDADGNRTAELVTVLPSVAALVAGNLAFAPTALGATPPTKTLTFRNVGNPVMTITGLSGLGAPFSVSANNCNAIAADSTCNIVVTMATSVVGTWTQPAQAGGVGNNVSVTASGSVLGLTATITQSVPTTESGQPYTITWSSTGAVSCVVEYSRNGEPAVFFSALLGDSQVITPPVEQTSLWSNTCHATNGPSARATFTHYVTALPGAKINSLQFGAVNVASSVLLTATLRNAGGTALTMTRPSAASIPSSDFSFDSTTCGTSLAAYDICTITVRFTPTAMVPRTGAMIVDTSVGRVASGLSGSGRLPLATISQSVATTVSGNPYTIEWGSTGAVSCKLEAVRNGEPLIQFSTALSGRMTISPPVEQISVWSNTCTDASGASARDSFTHFVLPLPAATISSMAFGAVGISSSARLQAILTNTGSSMLTLVNPSAPTINAPDFHLESTSCGTTLVAGGQCTYTVRYTPTSTYSYSGALIVDFVGGSRVAAGLSGRGI
jgi:YD repeat-containing protein